MKKHTEKVLKLLKEYESPNVTFIDSAGGWPVVWDRAKGVSVWDVEGKRYLDLTAAFGVAAAGHGNRAVVKAGQDQMDQLLHAMGDVHPHALKARLARELSRITFERWNRFVPQKHSTKELRLQTAKTIFCNSGFEAVEAALKTAVLTTGKPGIVAFKDAYHGLGYGALNATYRDHFRSPFQRQLSQFGHFADFPLTNTDLPALKKELKALFHSGNIGAILVEPIQVRGGVNIPPAPFLPLLRQLCNQHGALLILDEIYTGFGRTGKWFASEWSQVVPDLVCLGKALTGGFPLSACVGLKEVMDRAWPRSTGEAIHTSTYLGHPVGCAMALAQIKEIHRLGLVTKSASSGKLLLNELNKLRPPSDIVFQTRGLGLLAGLELRLRDGSPATELALEIVKRLLHQGIIVLPEGEHANIIGFSPPLTITPRELQRAVNQVSRILLDFRS